MKTKILTLLVILTFAFFSCQKQDSVEQPATDLSDVQLKSASIAVNDVAVEGVALEANFETDFYAGYQHMLRNLAHYKGRKGNLLEGRKDLHYLKGQLPAVSIDTTVTGYPVIITIDYGDSTVTKNGRVLSGIVKIEISGDKGVDGRTRKISFIGCGIDSIGIEGTSIHTLNTDSDTARKMTITSDVTFTLADGTIITREGDSVREWIKGLDTLMEGDDDMIQITGSIHVESSTGDSYTRLITEPLIRLEDCRYPVQGIVQYSQNDIVIGELNYGDGTCDNLTELTTDGETIEIELHGKMPKADLKGHHHGNMGGKGKNGGMGGH